MTNGCSCVFTNGFIVGGYWYYESEDISESAAKESGSGEASREARFKGESDCIVA